MFWEKMVFGIRVQLISSICLLSIPIPGDISGAFGRAMVRIYFGKKQFSFSSNQNVSYVVNVDVGVYLYSALLIVYGLNI